ncbi:hypothetical protein HanIR_Chr01g0014891 [Helianthus annuus]|nr:hypothetical protein HanIR_Chr01g0014891 [Helianthus annuus]
MSLGYAEKLSYIEDVGNVGMTDIHDPPHILQEKLLRFYACCYLLKKVKVVMCIEVWIQFVVMVKDLVKAIDICV